MQDSFSVHAVRHSSLQPKKETTPLTHPSPALSDSTIERHYRRYMRRLEDESLAYHSPQSQQNQQNMYQQWYPLYPQSTSFLSARQAPAESPSAYQSEAPDLTTDVFSSSDLFLYGIANALPYSALMDHQMLLKSNLKQEPVEKRSGDNWEVLSPGQHSISSSSNDSSSSYASAFVGAEGALVEQASWTPSLRPWTRTTEAEHTSSLYGPSCSPARDRHIAGEETDDTCCTEKIQEQLVDESQALILASVECDSREDAGFVPDIARSPPRRQQRTPEEKVRYRCPRCHKGFARSFNFRKHLETHQSYRPRPYLCPYIYCGQGFRRQTDLKRHEQSVHIRSKDFKCKQCGSGFPRKDSLQRHEVDGCAKRPNIRASRRAAIMYELPPIALPEPPCHQPFEHGAASDNTQASIGPLGPGLEGLGIDFSAQHQQYSNPSYSALREEAKTNLFAAEALARTQQGAGSLHETLYDPSQMQWSPENGALRTPQLTRREVEAGK